MGFAPKALAMQVWVNNNVLYGSHSHGTQTGYYQVMQSMRS